MVTLIFLIIIPIVSIVWLSISESKKSNVNRSLSLELIAFIGGWIATVALVTLGFKFTGKIEMGVGNFFYFLFIVVPTAVFYPGIYYISRTFSNNKLIIVIASLFITPLLIAGMWWAVFYFG